MASFFHPTNGEFNVRIAAVLLILQATKHWEFYKHQSLRSLLRDERDAVPRLAVSVTRNLERRSTELADAVEAEGAAAFMPPTNEAALRDLSNETTRFTETVENNPIIIQEDGLKSWSRLTAIYDSAENLSDEVVDVLNNPSSLCQRCAYHI